jgi:hypothetical protein
VLWMWLWGWRVRLLHLHGDVDVCYSLQKSRMMDACWSQTGFWLNGHYDSLRGTRFDSLWYPSLRVWFGSTCWVVWFDIGPLVNQRSSVFSYYFVIIFIYSCFILPLGNGR